MTNNRKQNQDQLLN